MKWPVFFSRKYVRAALVTIIVPKRFVSICARNSDRGVSSMDERLPYPALLMTTSSEPSKSIADIPAFAAAASSVTSNAKSLTWSPYRSDRSASDSMPRAVANTLLPAARPASTIARPRPRELPVTNHTCAIHPPVSKPTTGYSGEASQTQDWMRDGYTNGLVSYGVKLRKHRLDLFGSFWYQFTRGHRHFFERSVSILRDV